MFNKKMFLSILICIIIMSIGVSFAYFLQSVVGTGNDVTVNSTNLVIEFTDNSTISNTTITPGWTASKTFTVENKSSSSYTYYIMFEDFINTFESTGYLQYQISSTNNGYSTSSSWLEVPKATSITDTKIATATIAANTTQTYTINFHYLNDDSRIQYEDMDKVFSGKIMISDEENVKLYTKILADNPNNNNVRTTFTDINTETNVNKLYVESGGYTEDLDGDGQGEKVYYFSGDAQNNWVYFGGFYWRIIRINEDHSVRLLYSGTATTSTAAYIGSSIWQSQEASTNASSPWLVGWMYKVENSTTFENKGRSLNKDELINSQAKVVADNWYFTKILSLNDSDGVSYDSYVSKTAVYCNDRISATLSSLTANKSSYAYTRYGSRPSYKCGGTTAGKLYESTQSLADKFSVSTKYGNGLLTYPIGLMTSDEIVFAGGAKNKVLTSPYTWYFKNSNECDNTSLSTIKTSCSAISNKYAWLMTPYHILYVSSSVYYSFMFAVPGAYSTSTLGKCASKTTSTTSNVVRPVISLKACVNYNTGDGSATSPYTVTVGTSCAANEN